MVVCFQLADHFCNAVGVLQQSASHGQFVGFEKTASKPPAVTNEGESFTTIWVYLSFVDIFLKLYQRHVMPVSLCTLLLIVAASSYML